MHTRIQQKVPGGETETVVSCVSCPWRLCMWKCEGFSDLGSPLENPCWSCPGSDARTLGLLRLTHRQVCIGPFYSGGWACRARGDWAVCVTTREVAVVVGDRRLQDSKFCNIRERQSEKDHQRSFRAETPLITNTGTPPCHDPPTITILPLTHRHTHTQTRTTPPPISCDKPPPVKLTPTIPLPKHAALCQQVLVSSEQRNQKCERFLRHGQGLLIPSH